MRRFLTIAAVLAALGACAHGSENEGRAGAGLTGTNAEIAAEAQSLNHLTRISIDANRLYDEAADETKDKDLAATLRALSNDRKSFTQTVQQRVAALGAAPAETGQASQAVNSSLAAVRGLAKTDPAGAAEQIYRSESYLADELTRALQAKLTQKSHDMVDAELARVKQDRSKAEVLKTSIETRLMNKAAQEDAAVQPEPVPPGRRP